jgi:hypothetical protein
MSFFCHLEGNHFGSFYPHKYIQHSFCFYINIINVTNDYQAQLDGLVATEYACETKPRWERIYFKIDEGHYLIFWSCREMDNQQEIEVAAMVLVDSNADNFTEALEIGNQILKQYDDYLEFEYVADNGRVRECDNGSCHFAHWCQGADSKLLGPIINSKLPATISALAIPDMSDTWMMLVVILFLVGIVCILLSIIIFRWLQSRETYRIVRIVQPIIQDK